MYSRLQNLILLVAAAGWGVSLLGVVLPWPAAAAGLQGLGAGPLPHDPMLDYWLRMAGGGFSIVGALFAAILVAPRKYAVLLPLLAWLSLAEGIILLISGLRLGLPPFPFWADTAFCLGTGAGLLLTTPRAQKEQEPKLAEPPCPTVPCGKY